MKVSNEDRRNIYELCKTYLGGKWTQTLETNIIIETIPDGNINKLFICRLPEGMDTEYKSVVIRYNTQGMEKFKSDTHVVAISLILSGMNISSKLLGVFSNGTISQFIESRYFNSKDDVNPRSSAKLAKILATIHSLKIPVPKTKNLMFLTDIDQPLFEIIWKSYKVGAAQKVMFEQNYKTLLNMDLDEEMKWLTKVTQAISCPLVFSHNDFNKRNILVKETKGSEEMQIFIIDFEWTAYNYRGVDFGQYFSSWGQTQPEFDSGDFPTDEQMYAFIDSYIEEMCKIFGDSYAKQEINSRQQLIKEAKVFALMAFIKDIVFTIWMSETDKNILAKGEVRYQCYKALKVKILQEYSLSS